MFLNAADFRLLGDDKHFYFVQEKQHNKTNNEREEGELIKHAIVCRLVVGIVDDFFFSVFFFLLSDRVNNKKHVIVFTSKKLV